ncbi:Transmembrane protein 214 [Arabidopsis thaliana x Arabidopsis arenosa]|uniref:Transmembrane protein 214 n=1 Tax=Arabidopsis thaliana x Arabidopsis arenosa TaxID=1240361 RepID=A0A8T2A9Y4_9BRAS|nr:Transmembrane protein 214 [Arabidopsis thaliana x Arabidopsis arenosa]
MDQLSCNSHVDDDDDHGWTKVVSRKRNRKLKPADVDVSGNIVPNEGRILTAQIVSADIEDKWNRAGVASNENLKAEKTKKTKPKKEKKKPIVSLSEAMSKIDHSRLKAFLVVSLESYSAEPETQLLRFMDYVGRELTQVRFPWLKIFPFKGPWPKLIDVINVPVCDIPEPIYKTSVDWIKQVPVMTLSGFIVWAFRCTLIHLEAQQEGVNSGKIGEQPTSPKPHVVVFVTLAMVLRTRPETFTFALRTIRQRRMFQGQDKIPLTVWMMAQASQGYLCAGLLSWAHNLLPVVGNSDCNPQSRDLILQLVEKILSDPMAWTMRRNQAIRERERLIPPPSFEILLRLTFPASSARVKATERFEAIYPSLKEVALAGAPGSEAMKQVIKQIFTLSLKLAKEGNPTLAKEATEIAIWCVTEHVDCCEHWDNLYMRNPAASFAVLKKLVDDWKYHSLKIFSSPRNTLTLGQTMKSFRLENQKAITEGGAGGANVSLYKEADKYCKLISRRLSYNQYCLKATAVVLAAAGATAAVVLSSNMELKNLVNSLDLHLYLNAITTAFNI